GGMHLVLQQVLHDEPVPPRKLNDRIARDLETVTLKCLAKEPERRYQTAQELVDDLRRWVDGEAIRARPGGKFEHTWRWCRRNPAAAAQVVAALTLVGLSVGSALWLERQRAEQRAYTARQQGREWQEWHATEAVLEQAASLQKQGRWPEARAV